jgi:sec-independent protein translocase protein TatA
MGALKPWHIIVLVVVLILLFGAKRLPDAARSLGRSLRIIKAETKGLVDDDNLAEKAEPQYGREPLRPSELHPGQPYQGQPQGQPYQGQPYQGQPAQGQPAQGQPYQAQQPYPGQQPQQPPAAPYVDPVQRTRDH